MIKLPQISIKYVFQALTDGNLRKKWDPAVSEYLVINPNEELDPTSDIVYYVIKTPPGIENRDFLLERKIRCKFTKTN